MSSTILLAIRSTIQNRRNFFQENWVWNHLARILMCRATTSLSLGCTLAASLCCTTGIFRELSWGGGPRRVGLGLGRGAMASLGGLSQSLVVTSTHSCSWVTAWHVVTGHRRLARCSHHSALGDVDAGAVTWKLAPSEQLRCGAARVAAYRTAAACAGQPSVLTRAHNTRMSTIYTREGGGWGGCGDDRGYLHCRQQVPWLTCKWGHLCSKPKSLLYSWLGTK